MIEVNRNIYLTHDYKKNKDFDKMQTILNQALDILHKEFLQRK